MISRHWKGVAKPGHDDAYVRHLKNDTFPMLSNIPGFVRASILMRPAEAGTEFQIVTVWESLEAIHAFAGAAADAAVVPALVQSLMVIYDSHVSHYELVETYEPRHGGAAP